MSILKYKYNDLTLSADGDLVIGPAEDLYIIKNTGALRQGIEVRIKTEMADLFLHPKFGNKLKDMIGKRNTKQVAEEGKQYIAICLSYDGFINPGDLNIAAIPLDSTSILYHIEVTNESYVIYKFDLVCDLENGIRRI